MKTNYDFMHDITEICKIEIVEVGEYNDQNGMIEMTSLCVIEDIETFLNDFVQLECYTVYFADPTWIGENVTVVKTIYSNDEYELIHALGQAKYTHGRGYAGYAGYYFFDENAFYNLISKYI